MLGLNLYCLPFAGGSERAFDGWNDALPGELRVEAIRLPGRGGRYREAPVGDCAALVEQLARELAGAWSERPYALLGHSMGALIAYELARHATRAGAPPPVCLVVSGQGPPHLARRADKPFAHDLPDPQFVEWLQRVNPGEARSFGTPSFARWLMPNLRADVRLVETHVHHAEPRLDVPMFVYAGKDDGVAPPAAVERWGELGPMRRFRVFDGGHFFVKERRADVLAALAEDLCPLVAAAA